MSNLANKNDWSNSVNTNQIVQLFHMGQEKNSDLQIDLKTPGYTVKRGSVGVGASTHYSKYGLYITDNGTNHVDSPLDFTATFTNLSDTYYGPKDNRTKIAKIEEDFHVTHFPANGTHDNTNFAVEVNSAPQEGWWYNNNVQTRVTFKFFDQNGNQMRIGKNAYIAVSSLNGTTTADNYNKGTILSSFDHMPAAGRTEVVSGDGNITFKTLAGSSVIVNQDGQAYSPQGNDLIAPGYGNNVGHYVLYNNQRTIGDKIVYDVYQVNLIGSGQNAKWQVGDKLSDNWTSDDIWRHGYAWWDGANGANSDTQYFGATVGLINNNADSFTVTTYDWSKNPGMTVWAMVSTDIPTTPSYTLYVPHVTAHYHYNNFIAI